MKSRILGLLAVGLLAGPMAANAVILSLQPGDGKDTSLSDGANANSSFGSFSYVVVNWSGNLRSIGLVEFDLSGVPGGASIASATLSLYQSLNSCLGCRYDIFRVTSPWVENTVTFNTAPTYDPTAVASLVIGDSLIQTVRTWDLTSLVAGWVSGSFANYGFWIEEVPINGSAVAYFESSDGTSGWEPRLDINYNVPEPGTLALLSLGLMGLGLSRRRKAA